MRERLTFGHLLRIAGVTVDIRPAAAHVRSASNIDTRHFCNYNNVIKVSFVINYFTTNNVITHEEINCIGLGTRQKMR